MCDRLVHVPHVPHVHDVVNVAGEVATIRRHAEAVDGTRVGGGEDAVALSQVVRLDVLVTEAGVEHGGGLVPADGVTGVAQADRADLLHRLVLGVPHGDAVVAAVAVVAHREEVLLRFVPYQAEAQAGLAGD